MGPGRDKRRKKEGGWMKFCWSLPITARVWRLLVLQSHTEVSVGKAGGLGEVFVFSPWKKITATHTGRKTSEGDKSVDCKRRRDCG